MCDYKFDQDRFFDQLRDFTDFAEASERERQQKGSSPRPCELQKLAPPSEKPEDLTAHA